MRIIQLDCRCAPVATIAAGIALLSPIVLSAPPTAAKSTRSSDKAEDGQAPPRVSREELAEFERIYALADGEVLKYVGPPFPDCRTAYWRSRFAYQPPAELDPTATA